MTSVRIDQVAGEFVVIAQVALGLGLVGLACLVAIVVLLVRRS